MKVQLFIPCVVDQIYPETAFNSIKLLQKAGCEVVYNPQQTCCGQLAYNAGFWDEAKRIGLKFIADFPEDAYIVAPSVSCTGMVKDGYDDLFTNSTLHNTCRNIQSNMYEISDFLVNVLKKDYFGAELVGTAVYHHSCSGDPTSKTIGEAKQLLSQVGGLELLDMREPDGCCGFGGAFAVKFEGISSAMAEQRVLNAIQAKADFIICTDSTCIMQLQAYIDKQQLPIKTKHIADVLTSGWANI
ncbi:(Fe-S)-binding protein [Sphingobacterium paludis]|uniref:L-lactate dehydrogenase complex protein LldE n=1 Tax=Sphingobacterium paludis TaxID=1476465 RepID=A0A4R7DEU4_9SPHI|nr:(Fe-S)-binding protein [Sphingobacterium paludis]TDS17706.1 L-lactate dehydrogenase complex protein LldE [Sphingobacterium paludis]